MKNSKRKIQLIALDIPDGYLNFLEDLLFKNGLFKENNAVYIKGRDEPLDYELDNIQYAKFCMDYNDVLIAGRASSPLKIFKTFKVVFDYYQYAESPYRAYLLKDPSLIDTTAILSTDLVDNSLLESVLNTLDIVIEKDILELYYIHGADVLRRINKIPVWFLDVIELMEKISTEMLALIKEHSSVLDFSDGKHYRIKLYKHVVVAEELEDIRVVRYKNIIDKSRDVLKVENNNDILEEHLEALLTLKNEDLRYKNVLLNRLVYTTEKLEEVDCKIVDRTVIASINEEIPEEE